MELFDHPLALLGAQPPKNLAFGWFRALLLGKMLTGGGELIYES